MAQGTPTRLAKNASMLYTSAWGAFWFEIGNAFGLLLILQAYVIEGSFLKEAALAVSTFGQVDAESLAAFGVMISIAVSVSAFIIGLLFLFIRPKPISIFGGRYGVEKTVLTMFCFVFSLLAPGFIMLWIVGVQILHIVGRVKDVTEKKKYPHRERQFHKIRMRTQDNQQEDEVLPKERRRMKKYKAYEDWEEKEAA